MTQRNYYCRSCFRTIERDRDLCATCDEKASSAVRVRVAGVLLAIAAPLLIAGMIMFRPRLVVAGVAVAVVGIVVRIVRF